MFAPKQYHSSTVGLDRSDTKSPKFTPQKPATYKLPIKSTNKKIEAEILESSEKIERLEPIEKTESKQMQLEKKIKMKLLPDTTPFDRPKTDGNNVGQLTSPTKKSKNN
jgi:hypothetical protein